MLRIIAVIGVLVAALLVSVDNSDAADIALRGRNSQIVNINGQLFQARIFRNGQTRLVPLNSARGLGLRVRDFRGRGLRVRDFRGRADIAVLDARGNVVFLNNRDIRRLQRRRAVGNIVGGVLDFAFPFRRGF